MDNTFQMYFKVHFLSILQQQITSNTADRRDSRGNGNGYDSIRAPSDNLNDKHCGSRPEIDGDRIVGGEQTDAFEYPWNVALTLKWGLQFCGGSLINEWVRNLSNSIIIFPKLFGKPFQLKYHHIYFLFDLVCFDRSSLCGLGSSCSQNEDTNWRT